MTKLGEILQDWATGRSIETAAREAGIDYWVLRDAIKKGTCPRPLELVKLAAATGRSVEELALAARERNGDSPAHGDT